MRGEGKGNSKSKATAGPLGDDKKKVKDNSKNKCGGSPHFPLDYARGPVGMTKFLWARRGIGLAEGAEVGYVAGTYEVVG